MLLLAFAALVQGASAQPLQVNCDRQFHLGSCLITTQPCRAERQYASRHKYLRRAGRVLVCRAISSIGNLFGYVGRCVAAAQQLDLAVVVDTRAFPEMDTMLEPNLVDYSSGPDIDALMGAQQFVKAKLRFRDTTMIYPAIEARSFAHLRNFTLGSSTSRCALTAMFRWTRFAVSEYRELTKHHPAIATLGSYWAWHVRTSYGERHRFNPAVHKHVLNLETLSPEDICSKFSQRFSHDWGRATTTVYIATNSPDIAGACREALPAIRFVSFNSSKGHTEDKNIDVMRAAFLDMIALSRAKGILHTGSSFVSTMAAGAFERCNEHARDSTVRDIFGRLLGVLTLTLWSATLSP